MKFKRSVVFALSAAITIIMTTAVTVAHHDDLKGNVQVPPLEVLAHEFHNVVAASANDDSNAPQSHAPCKKSMAADSYPCDKIDMLSHLTLGDLGLTFANDIWGWTDPVTAKDYALIGGTEGTVIVDISDPKRPEVIGILPTHTSGSIFWRDIKVYADHAFVISEDPDHGMQVLDLTQVRDVTNTPVVFSETAHYADFGSSHNIAINEESGYAYSVGTDTCDGGLHMVDILQPATPTFAGCFIEHDYIHDSQCVIYQGVDAEYVGNEICFNAAAEENPAGRINTLSIVDVTNKSNPVPLARMEYINDGYSHQGWLTPDHSFFLHNDELDEAFGEVPGTTTRIWDVRDLDNPSVLNTVVHDTPAIGHNAYTEGRYLFASNYTAGLRIFDTTQVADGELAEVAFFDMYPENDDATFEGGTWSNYPYFKQKKVVAVSSMERGLFILRPRIGS